MSWSDGFGAGVVIGAALPAPIKGLEFALCALFTVLTLDAFRPRREIPSALLAVAVTAGVHLAFGRTILSVGIGTTVCVVLVNAF